MKIKKLLAVLLAAVLTLSLLSACTDRKEETETLAAPTLPTPERRPGETEGSEPATGGTEPAESETQSPATTETNGGEEPGQSGTEAPDGNGGSSDPSESGTNTGESGTNTGESGQTPAPSGAESDENLDGVPEDDTQEDLG